MSCPQLGLEVRGSLTTLDLIKLNMDFIGGYLVRTWKKKKKKENIYKGNANKCA